MSLNDEILVIVPARGGSKRIKKKNIKKIFGKPMIIWTLSTLFKLIEKKRILVSTDDEEISKTVSDFGLNIDYKRPKSLAGDYVSTIAVAQHALDWYEKKFKKVKYALIIYPTAILMESEDLISAIQVMVDTKNCSVVFSAAKYPHPIERAFKKDKINNIRMLGKENANNRTQDFKPAFYDVGQFYLCKSDIVRVGGNLLRNDSKFILIPRKRAIDIDNFEDLDLAKVILKNTIIKNDKQT